jgi:hypothetical protein
MDAYRDTPYPVNTINFRHILYTNVEDPHPTRLSPPHTYIYYPIHPMAFVLPGLAARAAGAAVKGVGKVGSTVAHEAFRGAETLAKEGLAHAGTLA